MSCLIADIGGTHTRCAITSDRGEIQNISSFKNSEFSDPVLLLETYLTGIRQQHRPRRGILGVAAPIREEIARMINIDWCIAAGDVKERLGLKKLQLLNDFEVLASALPAFTRDDLLKIGRGEPEADKPKVVLGPGTGLGVAALVPVDGGWRAVGGEGGHVSLAAADEREAEIILRIQKIYGHCSAERLISGPGLALLHELLHGTGAVPPEELGRLATAGDPEAQASLESLFLFLGTIAANLALTMGAFGGVYIGGGIIPKHAERFASSGFRERFEAKGRYRDYLGSIPTYLITAEHPTLTGLAIRSLQPDY